MNVAHREALYQLAGEYGIESTWLSQAGEPVTVSDDTLLAVLRMLGAPLDDPSDAPDVLDDVLRERAEALLPPVVVAWDGAAPVVRVRLAGERADAPFALVLESDGGDVAEFGREQCRVRSSDADAYGGLVLELELPHAPPAGLHSLMIDGASCSARTTLIAAPSRIAGAGIEPAWGVFAPLHALHDGDGASTGDIATLRRFARWIDGLGGAVVGLLPVSAAFVGHGAEPTEPSPYSPVSRRFWNEVYLDLSAVPELDGMPVDVDDPSPGPLVDLPALAARRRPVLEKALECLGERPARAEAFGAWLDAHPDALDYARFRAAVERHGAGTPQRADGDDPATRYHAYAQWLAEEQLHDVATELDARGQTLYLDLPVGTHRDGYDVAAEDALFVGGASVGAPPDEFQPDGQDWGFPPVHPDVARRTGYRYLHACLDAHLRHARLLRIDHVMGLHRLWLIPPGASARDGAYVRYDATEQWAVTSLVAARHRAGIVGENLGTVPRETDRALRRHGAHGMWVVQFEMGEDEPPTVPDERDLACLDTHDLPTFATWWHELAPSRRGPLLTALRESGALDTTYGEGLHPEDVLRALLAWLGAGPAAVVLASLDDLWMETEAQNRPGTPAHQNFRRRCAYGLDDIESLDAPNRLLRALDEARQTRTTTIPTESAR